MYGLILWSTLDEIKWLLEKQHSNKKNELLRKEFRSLTGDAWILFRDLFGGYDNQLSNRFRILGVDIKLELLKILLNKIPRDKIDFAYHAITENYAWITKYRASDFQSAERYEGDNHINKYPEIEFTGGIIHPKYILAKTSFNNPELTESIAGLGRIEPAPNHAAKDYINQLWFFYRAHENLIRFMPDAKKRSSLIDIVRSKKSNIAYHDTEAKEKILLHRGIKIPDTLKYQNSPSKSKKIDPDNIIYDPNYFDNYGSWKKIELPELNQYSQMEALPYHQEMFNIIKIVYHDGRAKEFEYKAIPITRGKPTLAHTEHNAGTPGTKYHKWGHGGIPTPTWSKLKAKRGIDVDSEPDSDSSEVTIGGPPKLNYLGINHFLELNNGLMIPVHKNGKIVLNNENYAPNLIWAKTLIEAKIAGSEFAINLMKLTIPFAGAIAGLSGQLGGGGTRETSRIAATKVGDTLRGTTRPVSGRPNSKTRQMDRTSSRVDTKGRTAQIDPDVDRMVERGIVEEKITTTIPVRRPRPSTPIIRGLAKSARERFNKIRNEFAKRLGVKNGGQVHHAIELTTLDRYPGVFKESELNTFSNMRGIATEDKGRRQLHNLKIREIWDRHYRRIDKKIEDKGLKPETEGYNDFVRQNIENGRSEIDFVLGQFFTEYRTSLGL